MAEQSLENERDYASKIRGKRMNLYTELIYLCELLLFEVWKCNLQLYKYGNYILLKNVH